MSVCMHAFFRAYIMMCTFMQVYANWQHICSDQGSITTNLRGGSLKITELKKKKIKNLAKDMGVGYVSSKIKYILL